MPQVECDVRDRCAVDRCAVSGGVVCLAPRFDRCVEKYRDHYK
jgi:hypothetical protein